jgi:hypothetical protein
MPGTMDMVCCLLSESLENSYHNLSNCFPCIRAEEIGEILNRHATLVGANADLLQHSEAVRSVNYFILLLISFTY